MDEMEQAKEGVAALCARLGLTHHPQDWGIVNADGARLEEFLAYYEQTMDLSATQKCELGELILASANERLAEGQALARGFLSFLRRHGAAFECELDYWRSLEDLEDLAEFPIGAWLRVHMPQTGESD